MLGYFLAFSIPIVSLVSKRSPAAANNASAGGRPGQFPPPAPRLAAAYRILRAEAAAAGLRQGRIRAWHGGEQSSAPRTSGGNTPPSTPRLRF